MTEPSLMMFEKIIITNKKNLLRYQNDIIALFSKSFNVELDIELWRWAYIDNVNGDPIVSLYFHKNVLVGHYAIIPIKLKYKKNNILAALSMTTMVDIKYRRHGLFVEQANEVYKKAKSLGFTLVYGFPNSKSAPGFKKRLDWTIDNSSFVVTIQGGAMISKVVDRGNQIYFNYQDSNLLNWRLSKPNQKYIKNESLILKEFEGNFDIVFHNNNFSNLEKCQNYNVLVEGGQFEKSQKTFNYIFGYKILDEKLVDFQFKKDLIMSDVF
jgi:hypothetical protein